jgi:hypothetical protein
VSDDGKTYTFTLRRMQWHNIAPLNGRTVATQDVTWSFERFMKLAPEVDVRPVATVTAPDARTVQFTLKDVYVPFQAAIGAPPVDHARSDRSGRGREQARHRQRPVHLRQVRLGISFTGKKNPNYYRKGEPHVDEIVGLVIPDDATAMAGLRGHELDFYQVAPQNVEPLKKSNPEIQFIEWEFLNIPFFYWKLDKPPFNDPRVRQAVSLASNRDEAVQTINAGRGNYNNAIPWALSEWWLDPRGPDQGETGKYFKYDPAAKQSRAAAAHPDGLVDMISTPGYGQVWVQYVELPSKASRRRSKPTSRCGVHGAHAPRSRVSSRAATLPVLGLRHRSPTVRLPFNMYHLNGTQFRASVNDPKLTVMIEQQTLDRAGAQEADLRDPAPPEQMLTHRSPPRPSAGVQPYVKDLFPRSTTASAELARWLDK